MFPIAFAVIIGRLTYQIARYKLEQGTTMGFLEQMTGSRTFGGAVLTQFSLGTVNLVGIGLVLLWASSPLGTQSMLRLLEIHPHENVNKTTVYYLNTATNNFDGASPWYLDGGDSVWDDLSSATVSVTSFWHGLSAMMKALVLLPEGIQTDPTDMWGNVKIPFFGDGFDNRTIRTPQVDWQDVVWSPRRERFSALTGVPIRGLGVGNTTFFVESTYVELSCDNMTNLGADVGFREPTAWNWTWVGANSLGINRGDVTLDPGSHANGSWQGRPYDRAPNAVNSLQQNSSWMLAVDRFVDPVWLNSTWVMSHYGWNQSDPDDRRKSEKLMAFYQTPWFFSNEPGIEHGLTRLFFHALYYHTESGSSSPMPDSISAYCDVRQKYVESRVVCEVRDSAARQNCTAVQQRPSRRPHPPELISFLNFPNYFHAISGELTRALDSGGANDFGVNYVNSPLSVTRPTAWFDNSTNADISRRLSQLINTFLLAGSLELAATVDNNPFARFGNITTEATQTWYTEAYHIPTLWAALSLLTGVVFLVGGIASIVFTHLSRGPEVLGFASTVVRDSKFMDLPPGTGAMPAADVSRMIQGRRVRYGYSEMTERGRPQLGVGPEEEMARIGGPSHSQ